MFKCEACNKEFTKRGSLTMHSKTCKPKEDKLIESIDKTIIEASSSVSDSVNGIEIIDVLNNTLIEPNVIKEIIESSEIDIEKQRVKDRLKETIRGCYDASTRHRLELEYFDLGGTREELMK